MKILRKENQKRAKHINERKNKQLKTVRDERLEKQRKIQRGMQALKEIQKYQKGADLLIRRVPFQRLVREIVQRQGEGLKLQSLAVLPLQEAGEAFIVGLMEQANLCTIYAKMGDHNAKRHPTSMQNLIRFLNKNQKCINDKNLCQ